MFLRNVLKFEIAGLDLSLGERETVRDSEVFEITEFEIAGFNCMYFSRSRFRERCVLELIIILS